MRKERRDPPYLTLGSVLILLAIYAVGSGMGRAAASGNAFKPGQVWPDTNGTHINAHGGGILTHNDRYYWFGQHMVEGSKGNKAQVGVHCYSSSDLYNWKDEGIALEVSDNPDSEITRGCILERPKVIYNEKTRKFVMWFHLELKGRGYSAARSGVATSDSVTGPYSYVNSFRPNAGIWPLNLDKEYQKPLSENDMKDISFTGGPDQRIVDRNVLRRDHSGGQMARDMTLFVDDDGKAYHIYASEENSTLQISQLTDDYLSYAGRYARIFENRWMEAPAICKRKDRYYLIMSGCTGWAPNAARSAVADSIFGPWTELGNPAIGKNADKTFGAQSTYIIKCKDRPEAYIAMFDIWRPENPIDGRYVLLPMDFTEDGFKIEFRSQWNLSYFD